MASSLVEHASLAVKPLAGSCHAAFGAQMTLTAAVRVVAGSPMNFWTRLEMSGDPTLSRRGDGRTSGQGMGGQVTVGQGRVGQGRSKQGRVGQVRAG